MLKRFQKPSLASNFETCPIPFRMDTYTGCTFGCKYCFARGTINFMRKTLCKIDRDFTELVANDAERFRRYVMSADASDMDYTRGDMVALKESIPIKVGTMSDPFPYCEYDEGVTLSFLRVFSDLNYPLQISTKNPEILADYMEMYKSELKHLDMVVSVSIASLDEDFISEIEPNAPSVFSRLDAVSRLTKCGVNCIVRIQPAMYPRIMDELAPMVSRFSEAGAKGIVMEGLRIKRAMSVDEREDLEYMNDILGYDIYKVYHAGGESDGMNIMMPFEWRFDYISLAKKLCDKAGIRFYVGECDRMLREASCSAECCATDMLSSHRILENKGCIGFTGYLKSEHMSNVQTNFLRRKSKVTIGERLRGVVL